jgi:predicted metal-dependent hydrolase
MGFFGKAKQVVTSSVQKPSSKRIVAHPRLGSVTFHRRKNSGNVRLSVSASGGLLLSYPWHVTFAQAHAFLDEQEEWAQSALEKMRQRSQHQKIISPQEVEMLRQRAKDTLLPRLEQLAIQHHFSYRKSFIKNNRSNWGSCSGVNNINLNLKIMLLPDHLRDYVLLHELCHTRIKNHGPRFWALLNSLTAGKAKILAKELRTQQRLKDFHGNP